MLNIFKKQATKVTLKTLSAQEQKVVAGGPSRSGSPCKSGVSTPGICKR